MRQLCICLILDRVGSTIEYQSGEGTFVNNSVIFASIVGTIQHSKCASNSR